MNILTLHIGHNASALLLKDGQIAGAAGQERFDNIKNSGHFPDEAMSWLLKQAGLSYDELDRIALCSATTPQEHISKLISMGIAQDKIKCIDHHTCHAYTPIAFFPRVSSPWLIFTADGESDGLSSTVSIWDGKELKRIAQSPPESSLGYMYGLTTAFLGMRMFEHEYKVMGLAAYAKPSAFAETYENIFKDIVGFDKKNPLIFKSRFTMTKLTEYLKEKANGGIRFDNIAGALQHCLEELILQWIRNAINQTGISRIMTGGGVFMNVKLNKLIREMPAVEETRFMPSCGDETSIFGAAYLQQPHMSPIQTLYLGQSYTNDEIEEFLKSHSARDKFTFTHKPNIATTIADLLSNHKAVARFSGRSEFGARSLGNRAILAHPSDMRSFFTVNDQIKARDFWMPFAPTILDTDAPRYLINPRNVEAPYMIDAFDTTPEGQTALCAAMHQGDKTVRPQILTRKANPDYYSLIETFKSKTGVGAVLNTSLNLHGNPLASTPEQALSTMLNSSLQYLALESWLVTKN